MIPRNIEESGSNWEIVRLEKQIWVRELQQKRKKSVTKMSTCPLRRGTFGWSKCQNILQTGNIKRSNEYVYVHYMRMLGGTTNARQVVRFLSEVGPSLQNEVGPWVCPMGVPHSPAKTRWGHGPSGPPLTTPLDYLHLHLYLRNELLKVFLKG